MKIQKIRKFIRQHPWYSLGIVLSVFYLVAMVGIYNCEKTNNPELTFFDAFRIVLVFSLGEYGDTPSTYAGRIISVLIFVLGILVGAAIIGKVAAFFVNIKLELKMPEELEDHIVMCNWNSSADRIIKEIHSPLAEPDTEIVVITEQEINETELRSSKRYEHVFFVKSDPTMHDVLTKARAHYAKSVIVLADDQSADPDAQSALISLAITKLEKDRPVKPHIVAEVVNHHKIQHLIDAGVDEWICAKDYGLGIIAQCAVTSKLSEVYQQLLTYSDTTNEVYLVGSDRYPADFIGQDFQTVADRLTHNRDSQNPAILIGLKRDEDVILNPRQDEVKTIQQDDNLIVIAFDQPDLSHVK